MRREVDKGESHGRPAKDVVPNESCTTRASMRRALEQKADEQKLKHKRLKLESAEGKAEANPNPNSKTQRAMGESERQGRSIDERTFNVGSAKLSEQEFRSLNAILKHKHKDTK